MLCVSLFTSCKKELDVQQNFPFEVKLLPIPKQLPLGGTAELRLEIHPTKVYAENAYALRYFSIDLVELFRELWNKKIWIALSVLVCTLIAGVYAFTAKEQWASKAEVIGPRTADLGDYFLVRKEYARIVGGEFDAGVTASNLFGQFNLLSESLDERRKFLSKFRYRKVRAKIRFYYGFIY